MRTTERKGMFRNFFRNEKDPRTDILIDDVIAKMKTTEEDTEEYTKLLTHLERLNDIKAKDRQDPVSRDTIAVIGGNVLVVLLIVAYEQKHVMTSKGFSQLIRPRMPGETNR